MWQLPSLALLSFLIGRRWRFESSNAAVRKGCRLGRGAAVDQMMAAISYRPMRPYYPLFLKLCATSSTQDVSISSSCYRLSMVVPLDGAIICCSSEIQGYPTWAFGAPDGQQRYITFTNGQYPGRQLNVDQGDLVEVRKLLL